MYIPIILNESKTTYQYHSIMSNKTREHKPDSMIDKKFFF